jgi:putative ABC transport system permease protein
MNSAAPEIAIWQMFAFTGFIVLSSLASFMLKLKLEKDLWIGFIRTTSQLLMMGFVLDYIFNKSDLWLIIGLFIWMVFWASRMVNNRVKDKPFDIQFTVFLCMLVTYILVSALTSGPLLQNEPWYDPKIFIPLAGLIIGNSMNAIALSVDRLFSDLRDKRAQVEQLLLFGANSTQACQSALQNAVRTGMVPSINSMMSVGLVFIPGMMAGQILGGQDPVSAAKYQIMIMVMISASTALGCSFVTWLISRRCFEGNKYLKL